MAATPRQFWSACGCFAAVLLLPSAIALIAHTLIRLLQRSYKPRPFLELAYGYLPLVLGASLAHYLRLGLAEAGQVIPVSFATLGVRISKFTDRRCGCCRDRLFTKHDVDFLLLA